MLGITFRVFFISLIAVSSASTLAQRERDSWLNSGATAEVSGHVRYSRDQSPAAGIWVRLERVDGTQVDQMNTDRAGKFRFAGLPRASYVVRVQATGFREARQQVDLLLGARSYVDLGLEAEEISERTPPELVDARVPLAARSEYETARAALRDKNVKKALGHLEKALTLYPEFTEAQLLMGTSYMIQRRWEEAHGALSKAVELDPKGPLALISLGEVCRQRGDYPEAERFLLEGLSLDDRSWQGHFALGQVYLEKGDLVKSGQHIVRTLQLNPELAEGHLVAGNIFMKAKLRRNALIEYQEYLRLSPKGQFAGEVRDLIQKLKKMLDAEPVRK